MQLRVGTIITALTAITSLAFLARCMTVSVNVMRGSRAAFARARHNTFRLGRVRLARNAKFSFRLAWVLALTWGSKYYTLSLIIIIVILILHILTHLRVCACFCGQVQERTQARNFMHEARLHSTTRVRVIGLWWL
eukprot:TRINITY_DN20081_c0_g1::TRINITY_DN20081_c0_g1_i1::g.15649::m.15649 TRINITY_DN20081_c0_g1::TRINITY_DN20081_c0_g1_i1::g.15649  ORF type:complete len:136 (-),score=4.77,DUF2668/PF10873.3/52,DUF2668/PF10873.3/6.3,NS3_envE/PF02723.9/1.8e+02,NS3_envE/PF02723.9/2.4 TRINITY_DN20081_c0_g1_i1:60-467(-)